MGDGCDVHANRLCLVTYHVSRITYHAFVQSALIFAAATTRDQRASSFFTSSPRRSGGPPPGFMPCFASVSRDSGCCSTALTSAFSFATAAAGVPAGANAAYHV